MTVRNQAALSLTSSGLFVLLQESVWKLAHGLSTCMHVQRKWGIREGAGGAGNLHGAQHGDAARHL